MSSSVSQKSSQRGDEPVEEFLAQLAQGRICLHPAGTLYGLTFDPLSGQAWQRLYGIKARPQGKKLLFLVRSADEAMRCWEPLPHGWQKALRRLWPAHVSVVWHSNPRAAQVLSERVIGWTSLGFRVPYYASGSWFEEVLRKFPYPLPTTSVNIGGSQSLALEEEIKGFAREHDIYCPPRLFSDQQDVQGMDQPSAVIRILDCASYEVQRWGLYSRSELEVLLALDSSS